MLETRKTKSAARFYTFSYISINAMNCPKRRNNMEGEYGENIKHNRFDDQKEIRMNTELAF